MSQIMKTFMGLFLILTMVITSAGVLSTFMEVVSAQNTYTAIVNEMEDSNYCPQVIRECFDIAQGKGYSLIVTMYDARNTQMRINDKSQVPNVTEGVEMARVELKFDGMLHYFGSDSAHMLTGYAR